MNKHELVEALQNLAMDSKEIVPDLHEHFPEYDMAKQLAGAAMMMLDWADGIADEMDDE